MNEEVVISKNALLDEYKNRCPGDCDYCNKYVQVDGDHVCRLILDAPVLDTNIHARWINDVPTCSNCGCGAPDIKMDISGFTVKWWLSKYCPNCGAKMDLEG